MLSVFLKLGCLTCISVDWSMYNFLHFRKRTHCYRAGIFFNSKNRHILPSACRSFHFLNHRDHKKNIFCWNLQIPSVYSTSMNTREQENTKLKMFKHVWHFFFFALNKLMNTFCFRWSFSRNIFAKIRIFFCRNLEKTYNLP